MAPVVSTAVRNTPPTASSFDTAAACVCPSRSTLDWNMPKRASVAFEKIAVAPVLRTASIPSSVSM